MKHFNVDPTIFQQPVHVVKLENDQNNISIYGCSLIKWKGFLLLSKFHKASISEFIKCLHIKKKKQVDEILTENKQKCESVNFQSGPRRPPKPDTVNLNNTEEKYTTETWLGSRDFNKTFLS